MPAPGAVLFDMDGLLVDTEPLWFETETEIMARLGGTWTAADQRQLLGDSMINTVAYLLEKASCPAAPDEVARWMTEAMLDRVAQGRVTASPGSWELVSQIDAAGIPCALVTGSRRDLTEAVIGASGFYFPVTVTADDVPATKPAPDLYLMAAKLLGVAPEQCVAIEDSPNGVASATAAGCHVIAVPSLIPIPESPGCLVVPSLNDITAGTLRTLAR